MSNENSNILLTILGMLGSVATMAAWLTWWLSRQFERQRESFYKSMASMSNRFTAQLDNHEKEDARRFEETNHRIHGIQLRNAARDGTTPPDYEQLSLSIEGRRYGS